MRVCRGSLVAGYREAMSTVVPLRPSATTIVAAQSHRPQKRRRAVPEVLWREALGRQLRRERHRRGERIADVAARAGVSPQYLSEIERGVKDPSSEMIAALAGALDLTVVELVSRTVVGSTSAPSQHATSTHRTSSYSSSTSLRSLSLDATGISTGTSVGVATGISTGISTETVCLAA